jgi:hypothetical protein
MANNCDNCFYQNSLIWEEPCAACGDSLDYQRWVAIDFLKDVPDDTSNVEGEKVMEQMLRQLERIKASVQTTEAATGVKYDSDKPRWSLLPFKALQEVVEVLTFGAKKYAADNWKIVPNAQERYIDAAYRHLADWNSGEKKDPETGKSHLAHAICCLLFLLWFEHKDTDV